MSDALTCPGCQKKYLWKSQYAGRKVKCRCGQVLLMPPTDSTTHNTPSAPTTNAAADLATPDTTSATPPPQSLRFELMDEPATPSRKKIRPSPLSESAESALPSLPADDPDDDDQDTFELAVEPEAMDSGKKLLDPSLAAAMAAKPSAVAQALMNREDELALSPWKEKYIPAGVAIVGVAVQTALWFVFATSTRHASIGAAAMLLAETLLLMPVAVLAVFVTARVMNIGFGPMLPVMIKVAAIAIGAGGVADILFFRMMLSVDFDYVLLLVGFVLHMFLLGLPILAVFELELSEMIMIVSIIVIPRIVILFGMGYMFPHWF